ncbi:hypothetical protein [Oryzobacter telluris]|uniref:hypothetical protein n=1 Tax=Oryzobacter telluris TaxID=3149179 RepID=UPI00370D9ADF
MSDTEVYDSTAGERDARDATDDVGDLAEDLFDLTGDEIPDELDVADLDDLVAATSPDVEYSPYDEEDEEQS